MIIKIKIGFGEVGIVKGKFDNLDEAIEWLEKARRGWKEFVAAMFRMATGDEK